MNSFLLWQFKIGLKMEHETRSDSPESKQETKTSFLIEDILYRGENRPFKVPERRELDRPEAKSFFPVPQERPMTREGSYLHVMGALGAYLHTPTYKAVETPYFLSQGVFCDLAYELIRSKRKK